MTEDERLMLIRTVQAVDTVLSALSAGCGAHEFSQIATAWDEATQDLRERIDAVTEGQKR